jgi:hypothetical protein
MEQLVFVIIFHWIRAMPVTFAPAARAVGA